MKVIFTADLHCEFETLDLVTSVFEQIFKLDPEVLVIVGDVKQRYNPIDIRVLNFVIFWILKFTKAGIKVFINLGNHDRVGLTSEQESWLPALAQAGAQVAHTETNFRVGHLALYFLPYRTHVATTQRMSAILANHSKKVQDFIRVLCFHNGLKEAYYNAFAQATEEKLSVEDLHPDCYDYVIGGHFHRMQPVKYKNVFYCGSPFATDWGEANDKKGFLVLEV